MDCTIIQITINRTSRVCKRTMQQQQCPHFSQYTFFSVWYTYIKSKSAFPAGQNWSNANFLTIMKTSSTVLTLTNIALLKIASGRIVNQKISKCPRLLLCILLTLILNGDQRILIVLLPAACSLDIMHSSIAALNATKDYLLAAAEKQN